MIVSFIYKPACCLWAAPEIAGMRFETKANVKTLILDGFAEPTAASNTALGALDTQLSASGVEVETVALRGKNIDYCRGCFRCWHTTPGECVIDDDARALARSMVHADLLVYLTPITFGGVSSTLKKGLDRVICVASPFFEIRHGEVHHKLRYNKRSCIIVIGFQDTPNPDSECIFRELIARNSRNFEPPKQAVMVVHGTPERADVEEMISGALSEVAR